MKFSSIIEQMCFKIGQLTIAMPLVISSHISIVCNAESKPEQESERERVNQREREKEEGKQERIAVFMKYSQQSTLETPAKAINL